MSSLLGVVILFVALAWILFPFFVINRCDRIVARLDTLLQETKKQSAHLAAMRKYYEAPALGPELLEEMVVPSAITRPEDE